MFFDRLKALCNERNISPYKACEAIGLNRAAVAKWKTGSTPNGTTAAKLADYFGVTTDYLLGKETKNAPTPKDERDVVDEVDLAFYGEYKELDEEQKATIRDMVAVMRSRRERRP